MSTKKGVHEFRKRLKEDPLKYQEHLAKERQRDAKRRENMKKLSATNKNLKNKIKKWAEQRARQRLKNKNGSHSNCLNCESPEKRACSCPQTMGKALSKLRNSLPKSPRKKIAVVKILVYSELPEVKTFCKEKRKQDTRNQVKKLKRKYKISS